MKIIIAGSREFTDYEFLKSKLIKFNPIMNEIVSGCARGVDTLAINYAKEYNIVCKKFPVSQSEWSLYGKRAGHLRNGRMAVYADGLIAFWDGKSKGTYNMISQMKSLKKPVYVIRTDLSMGTQNNSVYDF